MSRQIAWTITALLGVALAVATWSEWHMPTLRAPDDHIVATALYAFLWTVALAYLWVGVESERDERRA